MYSPQFLRVHSVLSSNKKMNRLENQYFILNKTLLLSIGLWPYQQSKFERFQFIFFCSILITAIVFQVTIFVTSRCTFDLVIKVVSTTLLFAICTLTYVSFSANTEVFKDLMTQLQYVYNELRNENEHAIIEKYGYNAKCLTIVLITGGIFAGFLFTIGQFWSKFFDIVSPMNKSRPHNIIFLTEYFVDQERYYFLIFLHMNAALGIAAIGIIATGTTLVTYLLLTCGMFRIACHRLERTIEINILGNNSLKRKNAMYNDIIYAIDIHRQAIKLSGLLVSRFEFMLFMLTGGLVILMSLNLFRMSQIMLSRNYEIVEFLLPFVCVFTSIIYLFVAHSTAQMVTDHNSYVIFTAYNVQWYATPLCIQKIILFLLQKGAKDFTLTIGGIFVASLECFATLVKAAVSYFTVMHSAR